MSEANEMDVVRHKQGCEALGGYGNGVGPCTCGMSADLPKLPEPVAPLRIGYSGQWVVTLPEAEYYTADQMRAFAQEAARQAMEQIAQMCDEVYELRAKQGFPREASMARRIRDEVRALSKGNQ